MDGIFDLQAMLGPKQRSHMESNGSFKTVKNAGEVIEFLAITGKMRPHDIIVDLPKVELVWDVDASGYYDVMRIYPDFLDVVVYQVGAVDRRKSLLMYSRFEFKDFYASLLLKCAEQFSQEELAFLCDKWGLDFADFCEEPSVLVRRC